MTTPPLSIHLALLLAPFLAPSDVFCCQRVSKQWNEVFTTPIIIRTFLRTHLRGLTPPTTTTTAKPQSSSSSSSSSSDADAATFRHLSRRLSALQHARPRTLLYIPIIRGPPGLVEYVYHYAGNVLAFQSLDGADHSVITLLHLHTSSSTLQTFKLASGDARGRLHILRYCPISKLLTAQTETTNKALQRTTTHLESFRISSTTSSPEMVRSFDLTTSVAYDLVVRRLVQLTGEYYAMVTIHALSKIHLYVWHVPSGTQTISVSLAKHRPAVPIALSLSTEGTAIVAFTPASETVVSIHSSSSADADANVPAVVTHSLYGPSMGEYMGGGMHALTLLPNGTPRAADTRAHTLRVTDTRVQIRCPASGETAVDITAVKYGDLAAAGTTVTHTLFPSSSSSSSSSTTPTSKTHEDSHLYSPLFYTPGKTDWVPAASRILSSPSGAVRFSLRCEAKQYERAQSRLLAFWLSIQLPQQQQEGEGDGPGPGKEILWGRVFPSYQPLRDMEEIVLGDDAVTVVQGVSSKGGEMGLWVLCWDGCGGEAVESWKVMKPELEGVVGIEAAELEKKLRKEEEERG